MHLEHYDHFGVSFVKPGWSSLGICFSQMPRGLHYLEANEREHLGSEFVLHPTHSDHVALPGATPQ